jgi:antibiotic biosynthesis monooxygenase (ABM) superfamily enzyme
MEPAQAPLEVTPDESGPVTISVARRVVPGREADYEQWLKGITADALRFPGHMGVNVLRPTKGSNEYVTIFRFDTYEHSRAWEGSEVRAEWLHRLEGIVEGEDTVRRGTGLEFWFSLPELPSAHPSPHKMALVLVVVVFTLLLVINTVLAPLTGDWPAVARLFVTVVVQVALMTYLVMPRVTLLLKSWLYS